jgi:hypothetical protein
LENFFQKTFTKNPFAFSEQFSSLIAGAKVVIISVFASTLLNIFQNYYIFLRMWNYTYIYIYKGTVQNKANRCKMDIFTQKE